MICARCSKDSKKRERVGGVCPHCRGQFAFDTTHPFTDKAFHNAMDAISAEGHVRWHVDHLYYELCRRKRHKLGKTPLGCAVAATIGSGILSLVATSARH